MKSEMLGTTPVSLLNLMPSCQHNALERVRDPSPV
jgi:hypothetical protein